ncbi:EDD domain protein, DegV family [Lachnospiraceae bacterium XBB1006]|nr:EDD domain protein, DegV family [Lachnospiraceae bacterium XBB1006]
MKKIAILTDSNSGIRQSEATKLGIHVLPMPFMIHGETYFEDVNLSQEQFYAMLTEGEEISTSMPAMGDTMDTWDRLLEEHDEILYIPMSSGLSGSCATAIMMSQDYDEYVGKVFVVDNHRISVTMRQSVLDAIALREQGMDAKAMKERLEEVKNESSIYIMVDTMYYLKRGGRVTPAAAALGTLLRIKPVLSIQGEKLDLFAKARTVKNAKSIMISQMKKEFAERFGCPDGKGMHLALAYTYDEEAALEWKKEVEAEFPGCDVVMNPLSLSVSCHIGPGALAIACSKEIEG